MNDDAANELLVLPVLKANRGPNGGFVLTAKYLDGVAEYAKTWPGPVTSLIEISETKTTDLDHVEVMPGDTEARLELRPTTQDALANRIRNAALVTTFLSPFELPTARLCQTLGVPIAFVSEYSVKTELQIIAAEVQNPLLRLRRQLWTRGAERKRRKALAMAAGLQCSGTPTYEAYNGVAPSTLLFFDNRVRQSAVVTDAELAAKATAVQSDKPLRLVFGGRMVDMKGVLDLVPFAQALRAHDVPFQLDIFGDGPLRGTVKKQIQEAGMSGQVHLPGTLDFQTGWIPRLKQETDLFVCCHPQGDPSSTYPEVMACGVPIAGYDNEAFAGITALSGAGWATPMHDVAALAAQVAALHKNRDALSSAMRKTRDFAAEHAFEITFRRRTEHMIACSRLPTKG